MQTYSANQVADYLLSLVDPETGEAITNLKIQKLCYYAQGLSMATRGVPLFDDRLEAWTHGPVVPTLYHFYKDFGAAGIPANPNFDPDIIAPADQALLDDVFSYYGQYSAWKLREMTHEEAPWRDAYSREPSSVITAGALSAHFGAEVSEDYRREYRVKAG